MACFVTDSTNHRQILKLRLSDRPRTPSSIGKDLDFRSLSAKARLMLKTNPQNLFCIMLGNCFELIRQCPVKLRLFLLNRSYNTLNAVANMNIQAGATSNRHV
jgi:hypothetical protein